MDTWKKIYCIHAEGSDVACNVNFTDNPCGGRRSRRLRRLEEVSIEVAVQMVGDAEAFNDDVLKGVKANPEILKQELGALDVQPAQVEVGLIVEAAYELEDDEDRGRFEDRLRGKTEEMRQKIAEHMGIDINSINTPEPLFRREDESDFLRPGGGGEGGQSLFDRMFNMFRDDIGLFGDDRGGDHRGGDGGDGDRDDRRDDDGGGGGGFACCGITCGEADDGGDGDKKPDGDKNPPPDGDKKPPPEGDQPPPEGDKPPPRGGDGDDGGDGGGDEIKELKEKLAESQRQKQEDEGKDEGNDNDDEKDEGDNERRRAAATGPPSGPEM